jgi:hypothetical protein
VAAVKKYASKSDEMEVRAVCTNTVWPFSLRRTAADKGSQWHPSKPNWDPSWSLRGLRHKGSVSITSVATTFFYAATAFGSQRPWAIDICRAKSILDFIRMSDDRLVTARIRVCLS